MTKDRRYGADRAVWERDLARYRRVRRQGPGHDRSTLGELARVLGHLGYLAHRQGDHRKARGLYEECVELKQELQDALGIGLSRLSLAAVLLELGETEAALTQYETCLAVADGLGDAWLAATALQAIHRVDAPGRAGRLTRLDQEGRTVGASLRPSPWYGRLIDAGGHRLYAFETPPARREAYPAGDPAGAPGRRPTVVLEGDANTPWYGWSEEIAARLAGVAPLLAYSRAGVADSEPGPLPRTAQDMVDDLSTLLGNAATAPPYVLVAHGFGCLPARLYARRFPGQVAGLVLLDELHEETIEAALCRRRPLRTQHRRPSPPAWPAPARPGYPPPQDTPEHIDYAACASQLRTAGPGPDIPVVCVVPHWPCRASRAPDRQAAWPDRACRWSPSHHDPPTALLAATRRHGARVRLLVAEASGRLIPEERPEVVVDAIQLVMAAAQEHSYAQG
ncbi:MAG TPA: tetratricopeptide repeat protein [Chloroflexota bacterium]|nr:tetratricopeptide repeat protein [Chloroflexota bacterium]